MPYITSVEQIGYDRGLEVGVERGEELGAQRQARSILIKQLTRKLGSIGDRMINRINTLSIAQLDDLGEALFDFDSVEDFDRWLSKQR
jgi:heme oxygenase